MKKILASILIPLAAACLLTICGCETDSANAPVYITPSSVSVAPGQSVEFTASGGYDYKWGLSDGTLGTLSTRSGPITVYTAGSHIGSTNATLAQVLTLTSTIAGQATGGTITTNQTPYTAQAEAYITHSVTPGTTPTPAQLTITASPSSLSNDGDISVITVTGGVSPYGYSVADPLLGSLLSGNDNGSTRTYRRNSAGGNAVTVTDSAGSSAAVSIQQP